MNPQIATAVRLTQTVKKGGCAAKVPALTLRKILAQLKFPPSGGELLIDSRRFDDAAIYKVSSELALVQTLDFFTPIVDDARQFGRLASANALSDVYAMGGLPKTAMAILAFPLAEFSDELVAEILQGALDTCEEAKTDLVGGHSIDDESLKFGLSVTGFVHPDRIWSNQGAKEGDVLILTKPLGTGTLMAGLKRSTLSFGDVEDAIHSMMQLNDVPARLSSNLMGAVHAATDITGFGLAGHSLHIAEASDVSLRFQCNQISFFKNSLRSLREENFTKAHRTNREYTEAKIEMPSDPLLKLAIMDPQTSGGLLLAVDSTYAKEIQAQLALHFSQSAIIGRVESKRERSLYFSDT